MIQQIVWIDAVEEAGDPVEEARLTLLLERLEKAGIDVARWDALSAPDDAAAELNALPALVIDGEAKCEGRLPTAEEWRKWIDFDALPRSCGCASGGCAGCPGRTVCRKA